MKAAGAYIFAGLFTQGVLDAGVDVEAVVEDGTFGVESALTNFPGIPVYADRSTWPLELMRDADLDLIYGNPPCAGYSMANSRRGLESEKNIHLDHINQLGWQVRPRAFLVESVPQLFTDGSPQVDRWEKGWRALGYNTTRLYEGGDHVGLPQRRKRAIFAAMKGNIAFRYPEQDSWPIPLRATTLQEAIGDLAGAEFTMAQRYTGAATSTYQQWSRRGSGPGLTWHVYPKLSPSLESLLPYCPQGVRLRALPDEVYEKTYWQIVRSKPREDGGRGKPSFLYRRLLWDEPCSVVTGAARYIHPDEDRLLTVREYARIMGLPDTFRLTTMSSAYAELGKAVSPLVGQWLAGEVDRMLADPQGREHQDFQDLR